jgi:GNAT superfamily N-acetyltransferase
MADMIRPPESLNTGHDLSAFTCGEPSLDQWLLRRAITNQIAGASKTYVITEDGSVVGYYCLATGAVAQAIATGRVKRNMLEPVPVMILGRLAIALSHQGRGLGMDLLRDAVLRTLQVADIVGCRALLAHALHEKAARFYDAAGFKPSPVEPLIYMVRLADIRETLGL